MDGGLQLGTGTGGQQRGALRRHSDNQSTLTLTGPGRLRPGRTAPRSRTTSSTTSTFKGTAPGTATAPKPLTTRARSRRRPARARPRSIHIALVNDGIVTVSSGTLDLEAGGTATGSFTAAAQTTLEFGHYIWAFNSTSNVSGAGTVEFAFDYFSSHLQLQQRLRRDRHHRDRQLGTRSISSPAATSKTWGP